MRRGLRLCLGVLLWAGCTAPHAAAAAATTATATMVDLLPMNATAGTVACKDGKSTCAAGALCICDHRSHCIACLTNGASLSRGEVAAVGAIAEILENKFNVECVTGATGAVSDFVDAYNSYNHNHYGDVAQELIHGMKAIQSTLKSCNKQHWYSKIWSAIKHILKTIPVVRAAEIVWDGVHILNDVLAIGPSARADDWMLLGNWIGDIVDRVTVADQLRGGLNASNTTTVIAQ